MLEKNKVPSRADKALIDRYTHRPTMRLGETWLQKIILNLEMGDVLEETWEQVESVEEYVQRVVGD